MKLLKYTMRARCHDGIVRDIERSAFFGNVQALWECLKWWTGPESPNGGIYYYFETAKQRQHNLLAQDLPKDYRYPWGSILWNSAYTGQSFNPMHHYTFVDDDIYNRRRAA